MAGWRKEREDALAGDLEDVSAVCERRTRCVQRLLQPLCSRGSVGRSPSTRSAHSTPPTTAELLGESGAAFDREFGSAFWRRMPGEDWAYDLVCHAPWIR